jgi:hypothetical protein
MFVYFVFLRVALVSCSCQAQALTTFFPKHSNMSRSDSNTNLSQHKGEDTMQGKVFTPGAGKAPKVSRWQPQDFGLNPDGTRIEVPGSSSTRENPAEPAPLTDDGADALFGKMRPLGMPRMFLANGFKKRGTATEHAKQQKRGTATEHDGTATQHAKQQKRGTATEHAKQPVVMKPNAHTQQYMEKAQADRADNTLENLVVLLADFLTHLLRELCPCFADHCEDLVFGKIEEWATPSSDRPSFYHESELLLHKKIWDVITRDVRGVPKENFFVQWCRRISMHHHGASTENADCSDRFRRMAEDIFAHDLTPEQKRDPKYKLREDKSLSSKQRSLVNSILRANMGDSKVAMYILDRGVPELLVPPVLRKPVKQELLQPMLDEFMTWYGTLLRWLAERDTDPNTIIARKLSDLNLKQWQSERRRRKYEAQLDLRHGAHLAELRYGNNKRSHDLSATEQRVVEDFECGKLDKQHDNLRVVKPNHWR